MCWYYFRNIDPDTVTLCLLNAILLDCMTHKHNNSHFWFCRKCYQVDPIMCDNKAWVSNFTHVEHCVKYLLYLSIPAPDTCFAHISPPTCRHLPFSGVILMLASRCFWFQDPIIMCPCRKLDWHYAPDLNSLKSNTFTRGWRLNFSSLAVWKFKLCSICYHNVISALQWKFWYQIYQGPLFKTKTIALRTWISDPTGFQRWFGLAVSLLKLSR